MKDIQRALARLVRDQLCAEEVVRSDVSKPVSRPAYKIDVLPVSTRTACEGAREREADIDIWYFPAHIDRPRDECQEVADALTDLLADGFEVCGVWIELDDALDCDMSDGVLVAQAGISWIETAAESGETMETLVYNGEECVDE